MPAASIARGDELRIALAIPMQCITGDYCYDAIFPDAGVRPFGQFLPAFCGWQPRANQPVLGVDNRTAGANAHAYLAIAASLAAGLSGIENACAPTPAVAGSAYDLSHDLASTFMAAQP
jgi:hypothetical protein